MSATDELRRLLDERGVEYETDDRNGLRETTWCGTAAFQLSPTAKMTMIVTPEQAIAATLGRPKVNELRSAGGELMAYGEFYVERQCWARFPKVLIMCRKHGRMENGNCAVEQRRYVPERTCSIEERHGDWYCTRCDEMVGTCDPASELCIDGNAVELWNYCPNCGCKVVG